MRLLGLIQLTLLAVVLFTVLVALVSAAGYPLVRRRLAGARPAPRARLIAALASLPAIAALALTALCFLPSMIGAMWPALEHCALHADGHPHFCLVHLPLSSGGPAGWLAVGSLLALIMLRVLLWLTRLGRSRLALRRIAGSAPFDHARGLRIVGTDMPLAITTGILRPITLVSEGLLRALPPELAHAVIEHERAHERRRDGLVKLLAGVLSLAHLPRVRTMMLADLELATEQACDEEAGERLGDRLSVARALIEVERLLEDGRSRMGLAAVSFGGSSLAPRVASLLAEPVLPGPRGKIVHRIIMAAAAAALLLADPLHHLTETLLGLLSG